MRSVIRVLVSAVVAVGSFPFLFGLLPWHILSIPRWVSVLGSLVCSTGVTWYVWRQSASPVSRGLNRAVLFGALVTGPAGAVLGGLGGRLFWFTRGGQR